MGGLQRPDMQEEAQQAPERAAKKLNVLWTSGDKDTALVMVFKYLHDMQQQTGLDEVTLLIWGAATQLSLEDADMQECICTALASGVRVIAARKWAEQLHGVSRLEALGVEVYPTGSMLTDWLHSKHPVHSV